MLEVQKYLKSIKTNPLGKLADKFGIVVKEHPKDPLVILNYHQCDSPKTHPVVRDCRGLVLLKDEWSIVARSFPRFFNWGEVQAEAHLFDWRDFVCQDKEDGSLILVYNFRDWRVNTRGSFAQDECGTSGKTWEQIVRECLGDRTKKMDRLVSYVFELVGPANKIIRTYKKQGLVLLAAFQGEEELPWGEVVEIGKMIDIQTPAVHTMRNIGDIRWHLQQKEETDPTHEGVVIRDKNNNRWKIKSRTYVELHRIWGAGNIVIPKNIVPFVLAGETDELLTYFPDLAEVVDQVDKTISDAYAALCRLWSDTWRIEDQKEFALAIVGKTPFTGILFQLRKDLGYKQTEKDLRAAWRVADAAIIKAYFPRA